MYWFHQTGRFQHFRAEITLPEGQYFSITRGEFIPQEPVPARWRMGRARPADVIWATRLGPVIFSDRIVSILKEARFTGWGTYRVALLGKSGETIEGYNGLVVHGRCGKIEQHRSTVFLERTPGGVFPMLRGLYLDPETWDGSDLFMPGGKDGRIFVVEAVKRAFEKAKVRNVAFEALDQYEQPKL